MFEPDYTAVKRSLNKKVKDAKKKDMCTVEVSLDYLINVASAFSTLLQHYRWQKEETKRYQSELRDGKYESLV